MAKNQISTLTIALLAVIAAIAIIGAVVSLVYRPLPELFQPGGITYAEGGAVYEVLYILLTGATYVLYLLGGFIVFFGAILIIAKFLQTKIRNPYQPSGVSRFFSGYLTLSLELFIGAEIIKTTTTQQLGDFEVLILIIVSRGLFSLILYLERRWHGSETDIE
jgi:uncharacterized membrane protein